MQISAIKFYGGSRDKIVRLGLADAVLELQQLILGTTVTFEENPRGFSSYVDVKTQSAAAPRLAVTSLLSTRKDRLIPRILRLRNALQGGNVDVGVVIVASDRMADSMPPRMAAQSELLRVFTYELPEACRAPILVMAVEHDGALTRSPKATHARAGAVLTANVK